MTYAKLPAQPKALRVISQQLWCCCREAGIVVFDSNLRQQRTIPRGDTGGDVNDVAELGTDGVVIATVGGLFQAFERGKHGVT